MDQALSPLEVNERKSKFDYLQALVQTRFVLGVAYFDLLQKPRDFLECTQEEFQVNLGNLVVFLNCLRCSDFDTWKEDNLKNPP